MGAQQRDGVEMVHTAVSLPRPLVDWLNGYKRRRVIGRDLIVERALEEFRDRHDSEHRTERPVRDLAGGHP